MSNIAIQSEAHWHELRKQHVGASESAALFGMLPWLTQWQLFMQKKGRLPEPDLDEVKHIKQGKLFEPAIAAWAAEKFGIKLNKVHRYRTADDCPGMGASLDYEQVGTGVRIPTEIKWVLRTGEHWEYEGDTITLAPDYYLIQGQHQLGTGTESHGQLIAFINGDVRRMVYERRPAIIGAIKERIAGFWSLIADDIEPAIDFKADADAVMRYAALMPVRSVEMTEDMQRLAKRAMWMAGFAKRAEEAGDAAKAELAHRMLEAAKAAGANDEDGKVICEGGGYKISSSLVPAYDGKLVTPEMVGERLGGRREYRKLTVSRPKVKVSKNAQA